MSKCDVCLRSERGVCPSCAPAEIDRLRDEKAQIMAFLRRRAQKNLAAVNAITEGFPVCHENMEVLSSMRSSARVISEALNSAASAIERCAHREENDNE